MAKAKEMLINVSEGEECRIALLEDGKLEELYMERTSSTSHVGNVYKGRVTNVEASIQAAFVDFGLGRNGFLHISDLMPTYFGRRGEEVQESVGRKMARRDRPPIQRCLRRGDEIVVQIIKEGIGTKGPTLSTYLSIPGRILVMMPGMVKMGVSKKIEDEVERRRLRQILDSLEPPEGVGFIIRTAGVGKSKTEIQRDLTYLTRLWQTLEKKADSSAAPVELYTEGDLVARTVRDVFSTEIDRIVIDNKDVGRRVKDVIKLANPRTKNKVDLYEEPIPLFHKYGIENQIELMYSRHVPLPSGGSLVIDSTEAVVTIDVNSGKNREHSDAEITAFRTDMEAADEIPRQLRLRDLGGVIICDFIDLRYEKHRRELWRKLNDNFKDDRAKTKVLEMSQFGIIEMTRQRMRPSLKRSIYFDCPYCKGAGLVKTPESMSLDVMRRLAIAINDLKVSRVELTIAPDVNFHLQNKKRGSIAALEAKNKKSVIIKADPHMALDEMRLVLFDARDGLVFLDELAAVQAPPIPHTTQLGPRPVPTPQPRGGGGGGRGGHGGDRRGDRGDRGDRGGFDDRRQRGGQPHRMPPPRDREPDPDEDRFDIEGVVESVEDREETIERAAAEAGAPSPLLTAHPSDAAEPEELGQSPREPDEQDADREFAADEAGDNERPGPGNERMAAGARDQGRPGDYGPGGGPGSDDQSGGRRRRRRRGRRGRGGRGQGATNSPPNQPAHSEPMSSDRDARDAFDEPDDLDRAPAAAESDRDDRDGTDRGGKAIDDSDSESTLERAESAADSGEAAEGGEGGELSEDAPRRRRRRRGGRGRRRRSDTDAATDAAPAGDQSITIERLDVEAEEAAKPAEPARAPRRQPAKLPQPRSTPTAPIDVPDTVRTGSTDRHLMHDEPVVDEPVRRPRSYRDLDQIPDDLE
jgi:ribonuclease E